MKQNSQDKGRGEGAEQLCKMASVAMQLGTKAIYTQGGWVFFFFLPPPSPSSALNDQECYIRGAALHWGFK